MKIKPLQILISALWLSALNASADTQLKDLGAIWFIGDSITQSNADGDSHGSPRKSLHDLLNANNYTFTYTGHHTRNTDGLPTTGTSAIDNLYHYHSGFSGIRIGEEGGDKGFVTNLEQRWEAGRLAEVKPNMILIMLGTNDVSNMQHAPERLKKLLEAIYDLPRIGKPKVFLASIPPNRRNSGRHAEDTANVKAFNAEVPGIVKGFQSQGKDVHFVDQFTALDQDYKAHMRPDNLHPNSAGNDTMAQTWLQAIEEAHSVQENAFPGEKTDYLGFDSYKLTSKKGTFHIVSPDKALPGKPWLWRSLFWAKVQQFRDADLELVKQGYHVVLAYGDVTGHPRGNANIDAAYEQVTQEYGFSEKFSMASMSRGTLQLFRWASANPEKVESIYVDNGVCNILSWPAGKLVAGTNSQGSGDAKSWAGFKKAYGFKTDAEAIASKESPIDMLEPLAKANVPILMVCGSKDTAVPYEENDAIMEERYQKLGGTIEVIVKNKGHSHGMKDPTPVLEFIKKHTSTPR